MDLDKFLGESFVPRTATIEVPELSVFFAEGEATEWTVKGLTAAELARANQAAERGQDNVRALVEAMAGTGDKAEALRKTLGISEKDVPGDISRRIELLTAGSVSPALGQSRRDVAVKLGETFPTVFYQLTNKILSLTGEGSELGKLKPSGSSKKSETQ